MSWCLPGGHASQLAPTREYVPGAQLWHDAEMLALTLAATGVLPGAHRESVGHSVAHAARTVAALAAAPPGNCPSQPSQPTRASHGTST